MSSVNPLERMVKEFANRLAPAIPLPTQHYDDRLTQWIAFHGLEETNFTTIVAHQAALNLILKGLICYLAGSRMQPNSASVNRILIETDAFTQKAGWGQLPRSYLDDLLIKTDLSVDVQAIEQLMSFLKMNTQ